MLHGAATLFCGGRSHVWALADQRSCCYFEIILEIYFKMILEIYFKM